MSGAVKKQSVLNSFSAPLAASTAHGLRMIINLVIVKMIAVWLGPAGMGILGQFMSLTTMISVFAGGGISTGIAKYVAEYQNTPRQMLRFIGAAFVYGLGFSAFFFVVSMVAAQPVSRILFGDTRYAWLFPCLGIAQLLCFTGAAVISIVNGQRRTDLYAKITITSYLGTLPIAYLLISNFGIDGAALALLLAISCTGFSALWFVYRSRLTRLIRLTIKIAEAKLLMRFTVMLLASATFFPIAEIAIRTHITDLLGQEAAGLWQAMSRFSGAYLGFFTVFLATNYMPRLSSLNDKKYIVREVISQLFWISFAFIVFASIIYPLRDWVIRLLFSGAFDGISVLFGWQLLGDFFRLSAYVIGFLGVAKAAVKLYIGAELVQAVLYVALSFVALENGGDLQDLSKNYALTYFIYLCITAVGFLIYSKGQHDLHR